MRQTRSYINLEVREHNKTAVNNLKKGKYFKTISFFFLVKHH